MKRIAKTAVLLAVLTVTAVSTAQAHFLWLVAKPAKQPSQAHLYFSEAAAPDNPALLSRVRDPQIKLIGKDGKAIKLTAAKGKDSIVAKLPGSVKRPAAVILSHRYGVISRGKSTFVLNYYAKHYLAGPKQWKAVDSSKQLALDITPAWSKGKLQLAVRWHGKPAAKAEVVIEGPGIEGAIEGATKADGSFATKLKQGGLFSIRVRHIEKKTGTLDGKKFDASRHYTTLALRIPGRGKRPKSASATISDKSARIYPDFPQPVTSFGGAIAGDYLYTYGGHMGRAHSYYISGQSNVLRRLSLKGKGKWEVVGKGPRMQGLAMVAYNGKLYRVGGFTAKNKEGEKRSLWSQDSVACFDPASKKWTKMASLPEPRSSHDAAMVGSNLYVVGGWKLHGDRKSTWHETAWVMDLAAKTPTWKALPTPPFQRRALALAAHGGKLYVIGGMQKRGGPSTAVDVYDPASKKWSKGPALEGKGFEGFGSSAFAVGGKLYVSTNKGNLQQLSADGKSWKIARKLERGRFFHRMLPLGKNRLVLVGGANMAVGKYAEVDVVRVGQSGK